MKYPLALVLIALFLAVAAYGANRSVIPSSQDAQAEPWKPRFVTLVTTGGGLWPQIQSAPDGALLALGYNAPAHTTLPADVDGWASTDGGKTWGLRGTAAARPEPSANYCHWASGVAANGDLVVLASGMDDAANEHGARRPNDVAVFRSTDFGAAWKKAGAFPAKLAGGLKPYPFGGIVRGADGSLRTLVYTVDDDRGNAEAAWMVTSTDDGLSWDTGVKVADSINESVLLPLGGKAWLCVARTSDRPAPEFGQELRQWRSVDDGRTWGDEGLITGYHKHPPHLLRLKDGRLVLTYGNRRGGGIEARFSGDEGKTWGKPLELFVTGPGDMGYPSTAQMSDGALVTVFYAHQSALHNGYHMGCVKWLAPPAP